MHVRSPAAHVCLVTPAHLSTNPRLVKEADALHEAGYRVSVVCGHFMGWAQQADREFDERPWAVHRVAFGSMAGRLVHIRQRVVQEIGRALCGAFGRFAPLALHPAVPDLKRAAASIRADLYIGHNLAGLVAAHGAARRHKAKLGFDAEDFHRGEKVPTRANARLLRLHAVIENSFIPDCDHLTAASPGIARAYREAIPGCDPVTTLNVFPRAMAAPGFTAQGDPACSPGIYWFSQTIGSDRGLQCAVEALALSRSRPRLFLQGRPDARFVEELRELARRHGVEEKLEFLSPVAPGELSLSARRFDVGLAGELADTENRRLCLSNKLFTYVLAGLPVLASSTPAQAEFGREWPRVISPYPVDDARELARRIDDIFLTPGCLAAMRRAAWEAGQQSLNWDSEKTKFLASVRRCLHARQSP